jgi:hypothetical protein
LLSTNALAIYREDFDCEGKLSIEDYVKLRKPKIQGGVPERIPPQIALT